jgi:hypothetical protein
MAGPAQELEREAQRNRKGGLRRQRGEDDAVAAAWSAGYDDGAGIEKGTRPDDPELAVFYDDGRKEGRRDKRDGKVRAPQKQSSASDRKRSTRVDTSRKRGRRPAAARRPAGRRSRSALRAVRNPVQRELTSGGQALALTFAVIALYLFLENATKVEGFVGFLTRGLHWLQDPTRSVPYAPGYEAGGRRGPMSPVFELAKAGIPGPVDDWVWGVIEEATGPRVIATTTN